MNQNDRPFKDLTYPFVTSAGEKQSMLKKLFGRNKHQQQEKKNLNKDSPPKLYGIDSVEQETSTNEVKEVELVTFSAQFPPPEWQWYESQQQQTQPPGKWKIC